MVSRVAVVGKELVEELQGTLHPHESAVPGFVGGKVQGPWTACVLFRPLWLVSSSSGCSPPISLALEVHNVFDEDAA